MSTPRSTPRGGGGSGVGDADGFGSPSALDTTTSLYGSAPPPTYAAFSSSNLSTSNLSTTANAAKRRSTILVHQKSPLLLATPPQVTRALAYSHPFLLPLNKVAGLLSWTTGDPWESFLLLAGFWATVLYGDTVVRWAGPIITVLGIIAGMYARRYSPLSSSGWAEHPSSASKAKGGKPAAGSGSAGGGVGQHRSTTSEVTNTKHQKTLDEIVETLKVFTTRCNILLEPMLEMTDFLSTQRTATSATTRPALTTLFVRILAVTPVWIALTLPPMRIITTRRVVMVFGTLVLSWHSRVCRVSRTLLWRSATVRGVARWITGLEFEGPKKPTHDLKNGKLSNQSVDEKGKKKSQSSSALTAALRRTKSSNSGKDTGVRFTFILYENQRRWVGLGWTSSLFAYERAAWTDEHNNPVPPRDKFELPEVDDGAAQWRWVKGSTWKVDGAGEVQDESEYDGDAGKNGWIYYDNKWNNGRRGQDGWGRWTRRRKWYRDAELIELDENDIQEGQSQDRPTTALSSSSQPPELPPRSSPLRHSEVSNAALSSSLPETTISSGSDPIREEDTDSVSVLSSSSKSTRWRIGPNGTPSKSPSLRRRTTNETKRSRRTSEVGSIPEVEGNLTPALELEIQGSRREQDSWGVGDDITMGLE